jgi:multiple sugar transport system permease protein
MMVDTTKGPFAPVWELIGLGNISWADTAFGARAAVMVGDIWQWTPFMFVILLAALEGISRDHIEAGLVDGANRWQLFRFLILPEIAPVTITVVLIRMIEAFKIIDIPNVLTGGGPGTATEPVSLYAYIAWRSQDYGGSAASAYILLFVVTFLALVIVNIIRPRVAGRFS